MIKDILKILLFLFLTGNLLFQALLKQKSIFLKFQKILTIIKLKFLVKELKNM